MFSRLLVLLLALSFALPATAQFAGSGVFILLGFSGQQLAFQPLEGEAVPFGGLAPTATRLRLGGDNLYVVNGDNFSTGEGASVWWVPLEELHESARNETPPEWRIVPLDNASNPYDLVWASGYLWVTLQTVSEVVVLDSEDDYNEVARFTDIPNPQGIAFNGSHILVAASGYGYNNSVHLFSHNPPYDSLIIEVAANPQEIAVDDQSHFHVMCSGRSWDTPPVAAEAVHIEFDGQSAEPTTTSLPLEANPGEIVFITGPEDFGGKVVLGDEYTTGERHIQGYQVPGLTEDPDIPEGLAGGWSLAAGQNGVFIGSTMNNTLHFYQSDWTGGIEVGTYNQPVSDLLFYGAGSVNSLGERTVSLPNNLHLSHAWPNPFNATTSITLTLPERDDVRVELFDVRGRLAATLLNGPLASGSHRLTLEAHTLASGVYLLRASGVQGMAVQRITLVR